MRQEMMIRLSTSGQVQMSLPFLSFQDRLKFLIKVLESHESLKISAIGSWEIYPGERKSLSNRKKRKENLTGLLMKRSAYSLEAVGSYSVVMTFKSEDYKVFAKSGILSLGPVSESLPSTEQKEPKQNMSSC